jgi:hypothetical protein
VAASTSASAGPGVSGVAAGVAGAAGTQPLVQVSAAQQSAGTATASAGGAGAQPGQGQGQGQGQLTAGQTGDASDVAAGAVPVTALRAALESADATKSRSEFNRLIARGLGMTVEEALLCEAKGMLVFIDEFIGRLKRKGVLKLYSMSK